MQIELKKRTAVIVSIITAALIVLTGAFAWNSLTQQRINAFKTTIVPGVNLHDDFDEPNKDVYVENSGEVRVVVRVRLTEFLQTEDRGSLVDGHDRYGENETDNARLNWFPHNGVPGVTECTLGAYTRGELWGVNDWFHDYYEWEMGGQKYYMPAKELLGTVEDEDDENFGEYIALLPDAPVCDDTTVYDGTEEGVRQTLSADIITMESWQKLSVTEKLGEFWVVDTDGWCYWGQMLDPDTATGLLLNSVNRTSKPLGSTAEYCINVWLQAADEADIDLFRIAENGGMTDPGWVLVAMLTEKLLLSDDGVYFTNNGDGSFVELDENGSTPADARAFIPLGEYESAQDKIASDPADRLYVGARFDFDELLWNGEDFENYSEAEALGAPFYNITLSDNGEYTVLSSEVGEDGNVYISVADSAGNVLRLSSIARISAMSLQRDAGGVSFAKTYPGTAPFSFIFPESDRIGLDTDDYYNKETHEVRYFYHLGGGAYAEVESATATTPMRGTAYYFDLVGEKARYVLMLEKDGEGITDVSDFFVETMQAGDRLVIEFTIPSASIIINSITTVEVSENDSIYTFTGMKLVGETYQLGLDSGYLTAGADGIFLKPATTGVDDQFSWTLEEADGAYLVSTRKDLDWLAWATDKGETFAGKSFKLTNDIEMGELAFTPIGGTAEARGFSGTLDGQGYTINGVTVDTRTSSYTYAHGFFRYMAASGVIKNLHLTGVDIKGLGNVGALVGYNYGTVEACSVSGTVYGSSDNVGGLIGYNENTATVNACTSAATVTGDGYQTGGLIGNTRAAVTNSSASGNVTGKFSNTGGLIGYNIAAVTNSHATGNVSGAGNTGGLIGRSNAKVEGCTATGDATGTGDQVGGLIGYNTAVVTDCTASGNVDGGGNNIGGLIGQSSSPGSVTNSHATGDVEGVKSNVGGLVGYNYGGTIADSTAKGSVTGENNYVGGLAGYSSGSIENSHAGNKVGDVVTTVIGVRYVGGLVGYSTAAVTGCTAMSDVTGSSTEVGGLIGYTSATGTVTSSSASGDVTGGEKTGGVVGYNLGTVSDASFMGNVIGGTSTGGIAAVNYGTVKNSSSSGTVKGITNVGGAVGQNGDSDKKTAIVEYCSSASAVTGTGNNVGGLVGYSTGTVTSSHATGDVTVTTAGATNTGGLAGYNNTGTVTDCYATGAVTGVSYVGGLAGYATGAVENSHATGEVEGTSTYVGGLVGSVTAAVTNCYSTGSVTGTTNVGGLAGSNSGTIEYCYVDLTGEGSKRVYGSGSYVGGIAGYSTGSANYNYMWGNVAGGGSYIGGIAGYLAVGLVDSYHALGTVSGGNYVAGIAADGTNVGLVARCVSLATNITGTNVGAIVGRNLIAGVCYSYYASTVNSTQAATPAWWKTSVGNTFANNEIWLWHTEKNLPVFDFGSHGESAVYPITSTADMEWLATYTANTEKTTEGKTFALYSDIDFAGGSIMIGTGDSSSSAAAAFKGVFDGQGYAVKNYYNSVTGGYIGNALFGATKNATIKNVNVTGSTIKAVASGGNAMGHGLIVGHSTETTIINCHTDVTSKIDISTDTGGQSKVKGVGGIAGYGTGLVISDCTNRAEMAIGTVGDTGNASYQGYGGIVGRSGENLTVTDCKNYGTITSTSNAQRIGGIVGAVTSTSGAATIKDCENYGAITAAGFVLGGIAGYFSSEAGVIEGCTNTAEIECATLVDGNTVGGIAGYVNGTIKDCTNSANVRGYDVIGGIAGEAYGTIKNCTNTGYYIGIGKTGRIYATGTATIE